MEYLANLFLMTIGAVIAIVGIAFSLVSIREGEPRAARISFLISAIVASVYLIAVFLPMQPKLALLLLTLITTIILGVLIVIPSGRLEEEYPERTGRFDEREVVFSRIRLVAGSPDYQAYYAMHPEDEVIDNRLRSLPGLLSPDARKADPLVFPATEACFDLTEEMRETVDGEPAAERTSASPEVLTAFIEGFALHLGAFSVGVTELNPTHVYSHVGRGTGLYGEEIHLTHRYAVAFTVEMDYDMMGTAPDAPVVLESARKYVDGAVIAIQLANFSRRLGYPARAHIDGNYRVIAPLVARDAGLGEIGRMGILMIPELGPRVRLGVVTTDLPLLPDQRFDGRAMIDFCSNCRKCAVNCPSNAIPQGDRDVVDGSLRWKLDEMKCFQYWNIIGTDCALCMTVCPYSHPNNRMHNFARSLIERSYFARRAALVLDDFLFGKKPTARQGPEWQPNEAS